MSKSRINSEADGKWGAILAHLGVDPKLLNGKNQPCPWCGGVDRFRFIPRSAIGYWICNHCGSGNGFSLLSKLKQWDGATTAQEVAKILGLEAIKNITPLIPGAGNWRRSCRRMWNQTLVVRHGDPVGRWLIRRGLSLPAPRVLRYMPDALYMDRENNRYRFPAMVAKIDGPDGHGVSLHRTFLPEGAEHIRKAMPGDIPPGSAIRLSENYTDTLGVAEGIETALSCTALYKIPTWSVMGTALMKAWWPPVGVGRVIVFADNDENAAGFAAAWHLIHRLRVKGITAIFRSPREIETDFNDVLLQERGHGNHDDAARPSRESNRDAEGVVAAGP